MSTWGLRVRRSCRTSEHSVMVPVILSGTYLPNFSRIDTGTFFGINFFLYRYCYFFYYQSFFGVQFFKAWKSLENTRRFGSCINAFLRSGLNFWHCISYDRCCNCIFVFLWMAHVCIYLFVLMIHDIWTGFFYVASVVQILYYMFECSVFALLLLWLGLTGVQVWSGRVFSKPNLWPVQGSSSLLSCHQGVKTTTSSQDKGQRGGVGEKDLTVKGKRCKVIKGRTSLLMFAHLVSLSRDRICSPTAGCHWWRRRDSTCIHELWPTGKLFLFSLYFILSVSFASEQI